MVTIIFESHSTTTDNENHLASGWNDVALSELGISQAKDLGKRKGNENFDAIFCSDLQRSYQTAEIAFNSKFPVIKDSRLRECNYGELAGCSEDIVKKEKPNRISVSFPKGESYENTAVRMKDFLKELKRNYEGKRVMIIGHRATQYGLEHWINGVSLKDTITTPWKWQPGWEYKLESLD